MADWQRLSEAPPSTSNPVPGQAVPLQPLAVQPQPPLQAGIQYYTQPYPTQVVLAQPQQSVVATGPTTNLPKYAFVTSVVATIIFSVLCWIPGLLCLVPATVMSIMALSKKEDNKLKEAKQFSIISFILVLIFAISYPILVVTVILASVFGYICNYQYGGYSYSYSYYYYRPSYCAGSRY